MQSKRVLPEDRLKQIAFSLGIFAQQLAQFEAELRTVAARVKRPSLSIVPSWTRDAQPKGGSR